MTSKRIVNKRGVYLLVDMSILERNHSKGDSKITWSYARSVIVMSCSWPYRTLTSIYRALNSILVSINPAPLYIKSPVGTTAARSFMAPYGRTLYAKWRLWVHCKRYLLKRNASNHFIHLKTFLTPVIQLWTMQQPMYMKTARTDAMRSRKRKKVQTVFRFRVTPRRILWEPQSCVRFHRPGALRIGSTQRI